MTEQVTITPLAGFNSDGDPIADGDPFVVHALEVAPGNTLLQYGIGGDLDTVDFTVFLPLNRRVRIGDIWSWQALASAMPDDFQIEVRNKVCRGRVQLWNSGGRGGLAVLATSVTGRSS